MRKSNEIEEVQTERRVGRDFKFKARWFVILCLSTFGWNDPNELYSRLIPMACGNTSISVPLLGNPPSSGSWGST